MVFPTHLPNPAGEAHKEEDEKRFEQASTHNEADSLSSPKENNIEEADAEILDEE